MTVTVQRWVAIALVAGAAAYLAFRAWRNWRNARKQKADGCGPGCGCH
ncbi:MAG: hypothetical protein ABJE47_16705 [bacterium]